MANLLKYQYTVRHRQGSVGADQPAIPIPPLLQFVTLPILRLAPVVGAEIGSRHPGEQYRTHAWRDGAVQRRQIQRPIVNISQNFPLKGLLLLQDLLPLCQFLRALVRKTGTVQAWFIGPRPRLKKVLKGRLVIGAQIHALRFSGSGKRKVADLLNAKYQRGEPVVARQVF